ncbi:origin recognition complex subunit 6-like [Pyrus ussuriensis x Pyrus communis]|uniref:Origin recognition complex subunit 6-like n=1 Tax=Pyrus ussuriensis x Pyrus communis TaxID=2448454 RepID=A0A5N5HDA9_9ROSA|nr:origin recognition complex subunit 6-like [Pyrus ussuriensis x Pyrus communis]
MADDENQNPPPNSPLNPQTHLTLTILLALATILFPLGVDPTHFVIHPSVDQASCECKLNNCPCLPPFYIFSVVTTAALSVVWFGLFVLSAQLLYRFVIWVGLGLVWATYWLALHGILAPQFYNPMLYSFNPLLAVLLLLNLRFRNVQDRAIHVLSYNWICVIHVISHNWDHATHVIADICVLFWNYITENY